jgi:hypothetical protein
MDIVKIIKKNTSIIIPVAITLVAALLFIPTVMIQGKVGKKLEQSQRLGNEIKSAISSSVSAKQIEIVKNYEDKHQLDANEIQKLAIQTSQRELLSYKIFPEPNESSVQIFNEFKKAYRAAFVKLVEDMKALDAPSDIEIRKESGSMQGETSTTSKSSDRIIELICKKRCKQIPVYAKPQAFSGYAFWNNWEYRGTASAVRDCWYCQLVYWIHQDIVDTINKMNTGSNTVADSSVKRLLGVRFADVDAANIGNNGTELPIYVTTAGGELFQPWTGRISNDLIDVIHFSMAVIIRADDILKFMNELCSEKTHNFSGYNGDQPIQQFKHNQITILQNNIESIDKGDQNHQRYRYGQESVVQLNLICEYVFNKEGYDAIEPNSVKQGLVPSETYPGQPQGIPMGGGDDRGE